MTQIMIVKVCEYLANWLNFIVDHHITTGLSLFTGLEYWTGLSYFPFLDKFLYLFL